jgi:hypothetical protein
MKFRIKVIVLDTKNFKHWLYRKLHLYVPNTKILKWFNYEDIPQDLLCESFPAVKPQVVEFTTEGKVVIHEAIKVEPWYHWRPGCTTINSK